MKIALNIVGAICAFFGIVWFLQGINILPGSFMTGQTKWAVIGAIMIVVAIVAFVLANRRKTSQP